MTNPTLRQFVEAQTFDSVAGFPQGDTFFDLDMAIVEQMVFTENDGRKTVKYKITQDNKSFVAPNIVYKDIKALAALGFKRVRVTRAGQGKTDTRYTVVGVNA